LPTSSVATQNVTVGHEIAENALAASTGVGADHVVPLNVLTPPERSAAIQKIDEAHETAFRPPPDFTKFVPLDHLRVVACAVTVVAPADRALTPTALRTDKHIKTAIAARPDDQWRRFATCMNSPRRLYCPRRSLTALSLDLF
jgi:hypothetical protein